MRRFSGDNRERLGGVMHERLVANEGWVNAGRISSRTVALQGQREGAFAGWPFGWRHEAGERHRSILMLERMISRAKGLGGISLAEYSCRAHNGSGLIGAQFDLNIKSAHCPSNVINDPGQPSRESCKDGQSGQ